MGDIEEEIDAHIVRKNSSNTKLSKTIRKTVVPLLLCDIVGAGTTDGDVFSVFNGQLQLKLCLLSGRIVGFIATNSRCKTYLFDDGTESIELGVFKEERKEKDKLNQSKRIATFYYKPKLVGSLRELLKSAKLFDTSKVVVGSSLIVLGRVSLFRRKVCVVAQHLFAHKNANRDLEIAFKDYLIRCYRNRTEENDCQTECY